MQATSVDNAILDKVKKLLNKAQGTHSEAEAETATNMARALLLKYNLEMSMVENHTLKDNLSIADITLDLSNDTSKTDGGWIHKLLNVLAISNFCTLVGMGNDSSRFYLIGKPINTQTVTLMYEYLIPVAKNLANKRFKEYENAGGNEKRNKWKRGYYQGFVKAIGDRLKLETIKAESDNSKVTDLIIVNKQALATYTENRFPNMRKAKPKLGTRSVDGRAQGYNDGTSVGLNKQVGSSNSNSQLN